MAKSSGIGMGFDVDGIDLSGNVNSFGRVGGGLAGTMEMQDITQGAYARQGLLRDGGITWVSYFDTAVGAAHVTLATLPTANRAISVRFAQTIGAAGAGMIGKQINYDGQRPADGSLLMNIEAQCNGFGLEFGQLLTAGKRSDSAATNGASYDYGAVIGTTAFGLQFYYQLYSFTGTSITISIQSSTDDGGGDAFAAVTGATTGALTTVGGDRIATGPTASVERYLRVASAGTFSQATYSVIAMRNLQAPAF